MRRVVDICRLMALAVVALVAVGCESVGDEVGSEGDNTQALYGYYYLGEERVAVRSFTTAESGQFLLKISPLDDILSATTYAVVGVNTALLGQRIDVKHKFHNDDYIFVYEDPVSYFSPYRPLQSGEILLKCSSSGVVDVEVDVVLYDGTPFRYKESGLKAQ